MTGTQDITIIGGGIVGVCSALARVNYVKSYAFFVSLKRHIKIIHSLYDFSQSSVCPETRHSRIYMFRDAPAGHICGAHCAPPSLCAILIII